MQNGGGESRSFCFGLISFYEFIGFMGKIVFWSVQKQDSLL